MFSKLKCIARIRIVRIRMVRIRIIRIRMVRIRMVRIRIIRIRMVRIRIVRIRIVRIRMVRIRIDRICIVRISKSNRIQSVGNRNLKRIYKGVVQNGQYIYIYIYKCSSFYFKESLSASQAYHKVMNIIVTSGKFY